MSFQLDVKTIAVLSSLTILVQVIVLLIQFRINRSYRALIWWLTGSICWAVSVFLMPLVTVPSLRFLAFPAIPLVIMALILVNIGVVRFQGGKENRPALAVIFSIFLVTYSAFVFVKDDLSARTMIDASTVSVLSFLTAWQLAVSREESNRLSTRFTAIVFFIYGLFTLARFTLTLFIPGLKDYTDLGLMLPLAFIFPFVCCMLWTFGFILMVNQRLNGEIKQEKENQQLIFHANPDAAVISRLSDGLIVDANAGYHLLTGYTREELIGNTTINANLWQNPDERDILIEKLKIDGHCDHREFNFYRKDGSVFLGSVSAKIITIRGIPHIISVVLDITRRKAADDALRESEELYRSILDASPDDITITDMQGRIQVISPAAKKIFGYPADYDRFVGSHLLDYIVPADRERARLNIHKMVTGILIGPNEYIGVRKDGEQFSIEVKSGLIHDAKGQPVKMVFVVRDVSERKQAERQIQELVRQLEIEKAAAQQNANTDSLTGLANRRYFDEILDKEFARLKRSGLPLSLLMIDVDFFKNYNDTYGHLAGDDCLKRIGFCLMSLAGRVTDLAARFGGEEFVVILTETDQSGALQLAERLRRDVEAMAIPHSKSDICKCVTVSLGVVTVYPAAFSSTAGVVALADDYLYRAKKEGRNRIAVASEEDIRNLAV